MILWYQDKRKWHCPHNSPPASQCLPCFELYPRSTEGLKLVLRALSGAKGSGSKPTSQGCAEGAGYWHP